jgi:hypothetical protein
MDQSLDLKKIASTVALAIIVHIVFSSVGTDYDLAVVYWLLYCLGCGLIINYDNINVHLRVAILAIPSPTILVAATYYRALFKGVDGCYLSGIVCALDSDFAIRALFFFVASILFIWLFSYLSEWLLLLVNRTFNLTPAKAKAIRARIIWIGSILIAVIGVAEIFAHGWRK